jgi:hypothetical protein
MDQFRKFHLIDKWRFRIKKIITNISANITRLQGLEIGDFKAQKGQLFDLTGLIYLDSFKRPDLVFRVKDRARHSQLCLP